MVSVAGPMIFARSVGPIFLVPSVFGRLSSVFGRLQNPVLLVLSSKNGRFRRPSCFVGWKTSKTLQGFSF